MPNHKSCKKRMKTSARDRARNRSYRSELRTAVRDLRAESSKEEAVTKLREVASLLDRAAAKGLIHSRNASRHKSRLATMVNGLA